MNEREPKPMATIVRATEILAWQTQAEAAGSASYAGLIPPHVPMALVAKEFVKLCVDQERRIEEGWPTSPVPLLALALVQTCGVKVDIETGRIIGWPVVPVDALEVRP